VQSALRAVLTLLALTTATIGGVKALGHTDLLRVREVRVQVARPDGTSTHVTEAHVRHLANIRDGASILKVDVARVATGVARHPWAKDVQVRRDFPDAVEITVTERTPAMVLALDGYWLVDDTGTVIHAATPGEFDHPFLTGVTADFARTQPEITRRIVQDGLAILDTCGRATHAGITRENISEVNFSLTGGYKLVLRGGSEVVLGFRPHEEPLAQLDVLARNGVSPVENRLRVDLAASAQAVVSPLPVAPPS
jgi:cell division protein FtsQ